MTAVRLLPPLTLFPLTLPRETSLVIWKILFGKLSSKANPSKIFPIPTSRFQFMNMKTLQYADLHAYAFTAQPPISPRQE